MKTASKRDIIRQAIKIMKNRDPYYNFNVLEETDNVVKVDILWTRSEKEVLIIKLKN